MSINMSSVARALCVRQGLALAARRSLVTSSFASRPLLMRLTVQRSPRTALARQYIHIGPNDPYKNRKNVVFEPARSNNEFESAILSTDTLTITVWTQSASKESQELAERVRRLVESGVGEAEGGINFMEVELDAPTMIGDLHQIFFINEVPCMVTFTFGWSLLHDDPIHDRKLLEDEEWLEKYIRDIARQSKQIRIEESKPKN
ncbi:hypothetical protein QBC38DRAFT_463739 [Podospora fimiseda]|uniref:Uncharacterized protein n=1 Tax=Podospora fimiseda TaxID=252190 RepID=A0AAN7H5X8_9PEZI|nr:hypothetical protein QBC38DRAFT_463739 [Podospora fimiseda]